MRLDGGSEAEARERTVGHILNIQVIFAIIKVILFMIIIKGAKLYHKHSKNGLYNSIV